MSAVAHTPQDAPSTRTKPGHVLICRHGECRLRLQFGLYFDGTNNNRKFGDPPLAHCNGAIAHMRATALAALLTLPLSACLPRETEPDPDGSFGSSVTAMDHDPSDTFVRTVYVDGRWVGSAGTGGSIVLGGIVLPNRWRPGLTAVVKWERCDRFDEKRPVPDEQACRWTEKIVPIHRYDAVGATWLHILPGDHVLIIPSMLGPGHPDYPGPDLPTKDFFRNTGRDATP
jgi:hypothetical protein